MVRAALHGNPGRAGIILASRNKTHWQPSISIPHPEHTAVGRPRRGREKSRRSMLIFARVSPTIRPGQRIRRIRAPRNAGS
jgi:hypothetical protein